MLLQGWIHSQRNNTDGLSQYEICILLYHINFMFSVLSVFSNVFTNIGFTTSELFHMFVQILTNVLMEAMPAHTMQYVRTQLEAIPANVLIKGSKEMVMNAQVL